MIQKIIRKFHITQNIFNNLKKFKIFIFNRFLFYLSFFINILKNLKFLFLIDFFFS
jgi:hypothetical protein